MGRLFVRPESGESVAMAADRMNSFLIKARLDHAGQDLLIAMHGRMIAVSRMILEGWSIAEIEYFMRSGNPDSPHNGGITIYEYSPELGKMVLLEYNAPCGIRGQQ